MKRIKLTQGKFALVDDADYERLSRYKWYAGWSKIIQGFYAARKSKKEGGKQYTISMAREILGLKYGDKREADHANHNTLDNRRGNLRICTHAQNHQNQTKLRNCKSGFKGVNLHRGKWRAYIKHNKKHIHLGYFANKREAAQAYDRAAKKYFGEFARLNFPAKQSIY